jgi:cyclohexyl-isocyanide hydratase
MFIRPSTTLSGARSCREWTFPITGGGITAGIDFGLVVAAVLCGRDVAERIQLMMEYNPAPPFTSGSPASADAALVEDVRATARSNHEQRRQIAERTAARLRSTH